ncbi:hypothetical protein EMCRGX_G034565 [Ephydatia muelleri]
MAENPADINELKSRLPPSVPEVLIRSTLVKYRGDKQMCYDHLSNTNWRHSALDSHVVSPEHLPPPIRRTNTYPDTLSHEQHQSGTRRPEKGVPTAQRRQLNQLQQRCDEIVKQLSLVKLQSDEKKRTLTDLRCMQIPTTQELQFQKDVIKTLESDLESQRQHNASRWQCSNCSFKNHVEMPFCEKCSEPKMVQN